MYPNGVAFRYECPESMKEGKKTVKVKDELTAFTFPDEADLWTQDSTAALGPSEEGWMKNKIDDFKKSDDKRTYIRTSPITVELPGKGGYALIQESGVFGKNWSSIKFSLLDAACKTEYFNDAHGFEVSSDSEQPWRVILVADELNDLIQNDIIASLPQAPDKKLFPKGFETDWGKPGRSA